MYKELKTEEQFYYSTVFYTWDHCEALCDSDISDHFYTSWKFARSGWKILPQEEKHSQTKNWNENMWITQYNPEYTPPLQAAVKNCLR